MKFKIRYEKRELSKETVILRLKYSDTDVKDENIKYYYDETQYLYYSHYNKDLSISFWYKGHPRASNRHLGKQIHIQRANGDTIDTIVHIAKI